MGQLHLNMVDSIHVYGCFIQGFGETLEETFEHLQETGEAAHLKMRYLTIL